MKGMNLTQTTYAMLLHLHSSLRMMLGTLVVLLLRFRPLCSFISQDKVNAFWEITKKDLEDKKAELRNKDREMEEMEERHQVEIKVRTTP
eukprot:7738068-Pyramimonas_sp.AAC.1